MALVSPTGPRSTVETTRDGIEIVIPAKRNWLIVAFMGFWLVGWLFGLITAPLVFFYGDWDPASHLFVLAWLGMWVIGGLFAMYIFLWQLVGRERVTVSMNRLSVKREVLGLGRLREYELQHVRNLRLASARSVNPFDFSQGLHVWGIGGGLIAFDHGASTVRFGATLEESEAASLIDELRSRTALD